MSTNTPGSSRRRRIAGERRPSRPETGPVETGAVEASTPPVPPAPTAPPARNEPVGRPPHDDRPTASEASETVGEHDDATVAVERRSGWWGSMASVAVLGAALAILLTLGTLAALGLLGNDGVQDMRDAEAAERAADTAPATAERAAEAILAYDHQTLEADQDAATRFMTDDFAEQYTETFEKVVRPTAEETRATVAAAVQGSATVRASADRVRVLLFVDQTTVSRANENPQVALNRVEMIMVRDGDDWLVDDITSY